MILKAALRQRVALRTGVAVDASLEGKAGCTDLCAEFRKIKNLISLVILFSLPNANIKNSPLLCPDFFQTRVR